jgi:hypothetical protein
MLRWRLENKKETINLKLRMGNHFERKMSDQAKEFGSP